MAVESRRVLLIITLLTLLIVPLIGFSPASSQRRPYTLDEHLLQIAERNPGFAGFFYDENGQLTVGVAETGTDFQLSRLSDVIPDSTNYRVVPVRYDFRRLYEWRVRILADQRTLGFASFIDIDERSNRILVGVNPSANLAEVRAALSSAGIPEDGYAVVQAEMRPLATLTSYVRPTVGGLQIAFSSYICTLGFNALLAGTSGYVTNSHCTNSMFGLDGTQHYQPTVSSMNSIGVEHVDPAGFTGGVCPQGYVCRYSDAVFGRYTSASSSLGKIARTSSAGSTSIVGEWTIVREATYTVAGEVLNKVGRTTGWSQGSVAYTCANIIVSGTNYMLLCQDIVRANADRGDSGSPVFRIIDAAAGTVELYGVLWGGGTIDGATHFVFSNIANIERELGDITTISTTTTTTVTITTTPTTTTATITTTTTPPSPRITVLYPNGGETLTVNSLATLRWRTHNVTGSVRILISRDGGASWTILFSNTANDGFEPWTVTGPATNNALIRVESVTNSATSDTSDSSFRIVEPPHPSTTVRVLRPNGGETLRANSRYLVEWTVSSTVSITQTTIFFSADGGMSWRLVATLPGTARSYRWLVPNVLTDTGLIKVVVTDSGGRTAEDTSDTTFRIVRRL